jgi:hypothetical protein
MLDHERPVAVRTAVPRALDPLGPDTLERCPGLDTPTPGAGDAIDNRSIFVLDALRYTRSQ